MVTELPGPSSCASETAPPVYERRPKEQPTETVDCGPVQTTKPPSYEEVVVISRPVSVPQLERGTSTSSSHSPRDYRKWCYASLFLFPPSGIVALVCSVNSRNSLLLGRYEEAQLWSRRSFVSNFFSTIAGVLTLLIALFVILLNVFSASGYELQESGPTAPPSVQTIAKASSQWTVQRSNNNITPRYGRSTSTVASSTPRTIEDLLYRLSGSTTLRPWGIRG